MTARVKKGWRGDGVIAICLDVQETILLEGDRGEAVRARIEGRVGDVRCGF